MNMKKYFLIFSIFIVLMCCVSAIGAASDDIIDNTVSEIDSGDESISNSNDEQAVGVDSTDSVSNANANDNEGNDGEKLASSEDDSKLTVDESNDKLSMIFANWYSIDLSDTTIASDQKQKVYAYISPSQSGYNGYDFNFVIFDKNSKEVYTKHYSSTSTEERSYSMTIQPNTLTPGTYVMAAINDYDGVRMDAAYLYVTGTAVVTANNYVAQYMSGAKMTAKLTDQVTGKPLTSLTVKVVFTKGKTSVTKYYSPNANGEISFVPPVGAGTWTVTIAPGQAHITGSAVKTATIKKSKVSIKAKKVTEYKGFKTTLKAIVKSNGKNVNEGKVTFKINGKTYKANVKNGVATKKINLKKVKTYKYTAKFNGNANLAKSKNVKAKAVLKKRVKVKINFSKKLTVYSGQTKMLNIKITAKGKKVKDGWLKIRNKYGVEKVQVKNGKVKVGLTGLSSELYKGNNGITTYYKKSVTKKYWVKYIPKSHKYLPKKVNYKTTTKYKCTQCGKKGSHDHYDYGYFVRYVYHIKVS